MNRIVLLLLFILVLSGCSSNGSEATLKQSNNEKAAADNTPDFRNINWGMTRDEVKSSETTPLTDERGITLMFEDKIFNLNSYIIYFFTEKDELFRSAYFITEKHSNPTSYVTDYNQLKSSLTEKYGTPTEDSTTWLNDLYKDDPNQWGMAVVTGKVVFTSKWKTDSTEIIMSLRGDNYEPQFALRYTGINYLEETKKHDEQTLGLDGL